MDQKTVRPTQVLKDWPDDVTPRDGPPLESWLPPLDSVRSISATVDNANLDGYDIIIVPKTHWRGLYDLLTASSPVDQGAEIAMIVLMKIKTDDDKTYTIQALSYLSRHVIYDIWEPRPDTGFDFAAVHSEPEVMAFFRSIPSNHTDQR
jgi:hypothetical protein